MSALSRSTQPDPLSPPRRPATGVLQIGDGNFLRAFANWMIDIANEAGLLNARVVIAPPRSAGIVEKLNGQDGLFTVLVLSLIHI